MVRTHTTGKRRSKNESCVGCGGTSAIGASVFRRSGDYCFLFRSGAGYRLLSERPGEHRRRLFHGRPGDDRLDRGFKLSIRKPGFPRIDGMGRSLLSVRHSGRALVLDRRDSGDVVSGAGDDAVLLHFKNSLRSRLSAIALWRTQPRSFFHQFCLYDRADERHQYVFDGAGPKNCARLGYQFQYLDFFRNRCDLCRPRRTAFRHLQ